MSPTVFNEGPYRFFFFSREEPRMHVHINSGDGEAKFWLEPIISLANYSGLNTKQLTRVQNLVIEHETEIREAWNEHFNS
jgi:hypothetical protein